MRGAGSGLPPGAGQPSACFTTTTSRHGDCERGSRVRAESVFAPSPAEEAKRDMSQGLVSIPITIL